MSEIKSYEDLDTWQSAMRVCELIYSASVRFPDTERFGLTSQIRRAAVSIPSNIAEGYGRGSRVEYARFLKMARGSMFEVRTQLQIASRLGFVDVDVTRSVQEELAVLGRLLAGLIRSVEGESRRGRTL